MRSYFIKEKSFISFLQRNNNNYKILILIKLL